MELDLSELLTDSRVAVERLRGEVLAFLDENRKRIPYDMYDVTEFDAWVLDPASVSEVHRLHFDSVGSRFVSLIERMGFVRALKVVDDHLDRLREQQSRTRSSNSSPPNNRHVN